MNEAINKHISDGQYIFATKLDNNDDNIIYYSQNNIGSTTLLTNNNGEDIGQFLYTPFGEMWVEEASTVDISHITRFFTNQQYDKESGLYYMNARYYDPHLGSFITPDPAMSGLNHYAYCSANPVNYTDPTGLSDDEQYDNYVAQIEAAEHEIDIQNGNISSPPSVPSQSGQDIPYGDQLLSPEEFLERFADDIKYHGDYDLNDYLKEDSKFINGWDYDINERISMLLDEIAYYHGRDSDLYLEVLDYLNLSYGYGSLRDEAYGVYSIRDGIVEGINSSFNFPSGNGYGITVWVRNSDGILAQYSHLSCSLVSYGYSVRQGDIIGIMGNTGTNDVHLHLSLYGSDTTLSDISTPGNAKEAALAFGNNNSGFYQDYLSGGAWPTNTRTSGVFGADYGYPHEGWDFSGNPMNFIDGWRFGLNYGLW